jgi:hypothetical protein
MARYFFHLVSPSQSSRDDIGTELPNAEAAYLEACDTALELSYEMLRERQDPSRHTFEITDADGHMVFELPFAEVTRPAERMPPRADLRASIHRHHEHASGIISELRANFGQTQSLLQSTKALLTQI